MISSLLLVARNILSGGMSAPHAHQQQQQFQTTDVNQCLHNKSSSNGVPNVNLFDFIFLLVDYGKVLCSLANNLQQNSNAPAKKEYSPQKSLDCFAVDLSRLHLIYVTSFLLSVICKQ